MKIKLSSQKKQCFEVEVEPTSSILDLKMLIIDHFGYPEDSISKISIVVKQVIVRDITKTLFDLGINEGSLIYFFAPSKLVPTKLSSPPQTTPKPENQQQTSQKQPEKELPKPQNAASPSNTANQILNQPKPEDLQSPSQPTETETIQKPTQPTETAQQPIPSEILFDRPKPPQNDSFRWPKPETNDVRWPQTRKSSSGSLNDFKNLDQSKVEQLKEMGLDERHARVFLKASLNNVNFAIEMMTNPFYQNEENFEKLEKCVNNQLSAQDSEKFQAEVLKSSGISKEQANASIQLFTTLAMLAKAAQSSKQKSSSNVFGSMQRQQQIQQLQKQIQDMQRRQTQNMFKQGLNVFGALVSAKESLKNIESIPIDQYKNPFIEMKQPYINYNKTDLKEYNLIDIGSRLNRDQVIFVSQMMKYNITWEESISILEATDGDIESARDILLNSK